LDPLSQACIGSAAAQSLSRKVDLKTALWVGALGGFLPDSDVLIRSASDPLLHLEYHRHFTHSLLFVPIGGLITAALGKLITRGKRSIRELWLPASLGWATHGLLDSCTSYGTYLFWPFSNERVAWDSVSIIDPLFTLPLLASVLLAVKMKRLALARAGLIWALAYLAIGALQGERAEELYRERIAERAHAPTEVEVKPSFGNNFLFRGFYEHGGLYYADSIRVPWWGDPTVYQGSSIAALDTAALRETLGEAHQHDLDRFEYFSAGFLVEDPLHPGVIGDFRYSMVPNGIAPMWGIDLGGAKPGEHADFQRFSTTDAAQRQVMLDQLWGRPMQRQPPASPDRRP
jgi:inner membrane protein